MHILTSISIMIKFKIKHLYIINNYTVHVVFFYFNQYHFLCNKVLVQRNILALTSLSLSVTWIIIY